MIVETCKEYVQTIFKPKIMAFFTKSPLITYNIVIAFTILKSIFKIIVFSYRCVKKEFSTISMKNNVSINQIFIQIYSFVRPHKTKP